MTRSRSLRHLTVAAVAAATLVTACGSSGGNSSGSGSGSDSGAGAYGNQSATTEAAGAATTAAAASGAAPGAEAGAVNIKGFAFKPADLSVAKGTTVTWTNEDSAKHRVKSGDGSFGSEDLGQGDTFQHTFDTAGTFDYICAIHPSMKAKVTVTG